MLALLKRVRNPKGRMKCYKFYAHYIVEKLIVRGIVFVSTLSAHENRLEVG